MGLRETTQGFWQSPHIKPVSYPIEGNAEYAELEEESFWFCHRNACILAVLNRFPPQAGQIWDVGGGNGFVALAIQKSGIKVTLVEPGLGAKTAFQRGVRSVIQASFDDLKLKPGFLPSVGLFDVIEHIQDDLRFLQKIFDVIEPNERVYLTVPAYKILWSVEDKQAQHFRRYTIKRLKKLFAQSGFVIDFSTYFFSFLPFPVFFFRTILTLLGRKKHFVDHEKAHSLPSGIVGIFLKTLLDWEVRLLSKARKIPFGGSIILVARKAKKL